MALVFFIFLLLLIFIDFMVFHLDIELECTGTPGHGSLLHKNTAGEKIRYIIDKFMDLRSYEEKRLENNPEMLIGNVTTINLTSLGGGVQSNVVPPELNAGFDVRIAIDVDHDELLAKVNKWCEEAGGGINISFSQKDPYVAPTTIDDSNTYWNAFKSAITEL